jgi:hypothetical protein
VEQEGLTATEPLDQLDWRSDLIQWTEAENFHVLYVVHSFIRKL